MSEQESLKRLALISIAVMLILGVASMAVGATLENYRARYLLMLLGGIVVVDSAVYLPIVYARREDPRRIAVPALQSLWISTSMGLGYLVTAPAPYFQLSKALEAFMAVVGAIMLVYGLYSLLVISRRSGVPLAV